MADHDNLTADQRVNRELRNHMLPAVALAAALLVIMNKRDDSPIKAGVVMGLFLLLFYMGLKWIHHKEDAAKSALGSAHLRNR